MKVINFEFSNKAVIGLLYVTKDYWYCVQILIYQEI